MVIQLHAMVDKVLCCNWCFLDHLVTIALVCQLQVSLETPHRAAGGSKLNNSKHERTMSNAIQPRLKTSRTSHALRHQCHFLTPILVKFVVLV